MKLETLEKRRKNLCLRFAKKCLKNEKLKKWFPIKKTAHKMEKRKKRKYETRKMRTKRFEKSAIPYMTNLLNNEELEKQEKMKTFYNCTSEL